MCYGLRECSHIQSWWCAIDGGKVRMMTDTIQSEFRTKLQRGATKIYMVVMVVMLGKKLLP